MPHRLPALLTLALVITTAPGLNYQASDPASYLAVAESHAFAGVVLIRQGDEILLREGYGASDRSSGTAFTPETAFGIGSLSKQFTAAAILHLVESGRLSLDATLGEVLEGVPADKSAITIHQILTHTAGFPRHHFRSDRLAISRQEAVDLILSTPLEFEAGADFHYADSGYVLLAALVEEIGGESFQTYVRDNLFEPAGLEHTAFFGDAEWQGYPVATGYRNGRQYGSPGDWPAPTWALLGAGGIVSTVDDMQHWMLALTGGRILPAEVVEQMFTPQATIAERFYYGYGWYIQDTSYGGRMIWHSGAGNTHNADVRYFPETDSLFIIGSNQIDDFFVTDAQHPLFGRIDEIIYSSQTNDDLSFAVLTGDFSTAPTYVDLPGIRTSPVWLIVAPITLILSVLVGSMLILRRRRRGMDRADETQTLS